MSDSSSFSSLMELIDNHMSKTKIQGSHSDGAGYGIQLPSLTGGSQSDSRLTFTPGQRLPIPTLPVGDSPIQSILAMQVANMLKAKEKREKEEAEEKQRLEEKMRNIKIKDESEKECIIDLMAALKNSPCNPSAMPPTPPPVLSTSSSLESLFEPKFIDCDTEVAKPLTPEPMLPCITDMSYILKQKIPRAKCSNFGKVLTSRYRPVAAPYLKEKYECTIEKFDFSTMSPCDIIKEKLRKPCSYNSYHFDVAPELRM
ncbi:hypothetical protein JYU34_000037 [Plutella xylostella]|uniref:Uncharacterized protein n=2 Tax=Plutella xylostella TaxID=51655 RepID=A0ABQ7R6P5_PLUXY|nr:hypothetical protein JYU34_000037 [Plutella xylostella]CAG9138320.1 unnamed protein product [Plutella xylostella]